MSWDIQFMVKDAVSALYTLRLIARDFDFKLNRSSQAPYKSHTESATSKSGRHPDSSIK